MNTNTVEEIVKDFETQFCTTVNAPGGPSLVRWLNLGSSSQENAALTSRMVAWLRTTLHQELQKALRCGKDMGDGSICSCKLDCHLHDWRQREEIQKARQDWLQDEIETLKAVQRDFIARWEHPDSNLPIEHTVKEETVYHLQTIIDRYLSELDQPTV